MKYAAKKAAKAAAYGAEIHAMNIELVSGREYKMGDN